MKQYEHGTRGERQATGAIRAAILRYLPPEIRVLRMDELQSPLFNHFNRHQEVTECWRKENGKWLLKPIAFVEEWDLSKLDVFYAELRETILQGGTVFAAFVDNSLIGFAAVESKMFGHAHKYVQMTELHVSYEWRGCGIGRKLFGEICRQARIYGAERLYISGHSSKESQAFYHALGCVEAVEYNNEIWVAEPCDCQLEYDLKESE